MAGIIVKPNPMPRTKSASREERVARVRSDDRVGERAEDDDEQSERHDPSRP